MIHPEPGQRAIGKLATDLAAALNHREIHHPAQQPPGDARRAARPAGNLQRALRVGGDVEQRSIAAHDFVQLVDLVELQPRRDAEPVAQGRGQQPQPGRRPDQREGLQLDPHGARRRPLADHQIELEILQRGIEHLFDRRVETVDLVDEKDIVALQIRQDCGQIAGLGQHRPRGHAEPHAQLARHDLRQRRLAQTGRPVKPAV